MFGLKKNLPGGDSAVVPPDPMPNSEVKRRGIWPEDVVELQMSHMEKNNVRAAYTHKAKHLEQHRLMLQWWADFLEANSNGMVRPFEFAQKG